MTGAEMVMTPALSATSMPTDATPGAIVRLPPEPAAIATAVIPAGLVVNLRSLTVKFVSNVVETVGPLAADELKVTVLAAPGVAPAFTEPARLVVQLVFPPPNVLQL